MVPPNPALGSDYAGDAVASAAFWIVNLVLGSLGTLFAVLAVAGIGFGMLLGRLAPREGISVILGCFILFGAASIARGLIGIAHEGGARVDITVPTTVFTAAPTIQAPAVAPPQQPGQSQGGNPFDPYGGKRSP